MKKASIKAQILKLLAVNGPTPKKALTVPFLDYNSVTVSRALSCLVDNGYVEIFDEDNQKMVKNTRKGSIYVSEHFGNWIPIKTAGKSEARRRERQITLAEANCLLLGAGMYTVGPSKVSLIALVSENTSNRTEAEVKFREQAAAGLFFSSVEIKQYLNHIDGSDDLTFDARIMGILVLRYCIYYVYAIGDKNIELFPKHEEKALRVIARGLMKIPAFDYYEEYLCTENKNRLYCLLVADNKSMLPKVYYGNSHGYRQPTQSKQARQRQQRWEKTHATFHSFKELFPNHILFFTPCRAGAIMLIRLRDSDGFPNLSIERMERSKDVFEVPDLPYAREGMNDGRLFFPLPILDMVVIHQYITLYPGRTKYLFAPKYYDDALSRCFGSELTRYYDCDTFQPFKTNRYSTDGIPLGKSYMAGLNGYIGEDDD